MLFFLISNKFKKKKKKRRQKRHHQGNNEALGQFQEVASKNCILSSWGSFLLDALESKKAARIISRPSRYGGQPGRSPPSAAVWWSPPPCSDRACRRCTHLRRRTGAESRRGKYAAWFQKRRAALTGFRIERFQTFQFLDLHLFGHFSWVAQTHTNKEVRQREGSAASSPARRYLPACFMSPMRIMWGQCCRVLAKKGLVTPRMTEGLLKEAATQLPP